MLPTRKRRLARLIAIAPVALAAFALFVWIVMSLWNWLMPAIFSLRAITYWQALGLMVLSWILFRGSRGGSSMGMDPWRYELRKRWRKMTPEEREQFIQGLRSRWTGMEPPGTPTL